MLQRIARAGRLDAGTPVPGAVFVAVPAIPGDDRGMSEHWQPSLRSWVIGAVLSLAAFAAFAIVEGLASGFQLLALILLLDALVIAVFAFIHRVK
jgi:hypothetical protein